MKFLWLKGQSTQSTSFHLLIERRNKINWWMKFNEWNEIKHSWTKMRLMKGLLAFHSARLNSIPSIKDNWFHFITLARQQSLIKEKTSSRIYFPLLWFKKSCVFEMKMNLCWLKKKESWLGWFVWVDGWVCWSQNL